MAPFYEEVCRDLNWPLDQKLLTEMKAANEEKLKQLEETIEDAEKNLGEMEVREANLKKSEYLCRIGDKVCFTSLSLPLPTNMSHFCYFFTNYLVLIPGGCYFSLQENI